MVVMVYQITVTHAQDHGGNIITFKLDQNNFSMYDFFLIVGELRQANQIMK